VAVIENSTRTFPGAIPGAAARETLLYPSQAKAAQRKIRLRLVAAYVHRFGSDEFSAQFSHPRMQSRGKVTATGCRTAMRGGVNGPRGRRTERVGMVSARPNKPLVPTRKGEAPLLAAQAGR
jgi:hypothetical protein